MRCTHIVLVEVALPRGNVQALQLAADFSALDVQSVARTLRCSLMNQRVFVMRGGSDAEIVVPRSGPSCVGGKR